MIKKYFILLLSILTICSLYCGIHFLFSNDRIKLKELEDYKFFNNYFPDSANAMLYDMSYSQTYLNKKLPLSFIENLKYTNFLDIGSGGGIASIHHLHNIFGKNIKIILSDLYPKNKLWKKIKTNNVSYISKPVDATYNLSEYLPQNYNISLFGSLHHMDEETISSIFNQIVINNTSMFIVEPRRFPFIIQFLHIILLPFGLIFYTIICLFGSMFHDTNIINSFIRILTVPFFMTFDHIVGATRRYSFNKIKTIANKYNLTSFHYYDNTFDYYIIR